MLLRLLGASLLLGAGGTAWTATTGSKAQVVKAARIYTGREVLEPGELLIVDGKIAAAGKSVKAPAGAEVHDYGSATIMPGIVLATSSLVATSRSRDEPDSMTAQHRAADGFDAMDDQRPALLGGVTTAYLSPGADRLISGQGAVVKLGGGDTVGEVLLADGSLEIHFGPAAWAPDAKVVPPIPPSSDNPIIPAERQYPTTRMGQILGVHEALRAAESPADASSLALAAYLKSRRPVRIRAVEAPDLLAAIDVALELQRPAVLAGGPDSHKVKERLLQHRFPFVLELGMSWNAPPADRGLDPDRAVVDPGVARDLVAGGVPVAITVPYGAPLADALLSGALARRGGLSTAEVVAAMTRVPAEILGVADRVGSLEVGRDADFLVLSGEPFSTAGHVQETFVSGHSVAHRAGASDPDDARAIVVRAGLVLIGDGTFVQDGAVVVQNGRITSVGRSVATPPNARVVDAGPHAVITPGFIDANSHLGLDSDRSNMGLELDLTRVIAGADETDLEVAASGVTTVVLQPYSGTGNGSRTAAIKTGGDTRDERIVDDLAGLRFSWGSRSDPLLAAENLRGRLKAGKDYHDKWVKYYEDLKKWEEEQAKAEATGKKAPPKPKEEPVVVEETQTEQKVDPITGKWEVEVSGGPLPEPQEATLKLKLTGSNVTGSFEGLFGGGDGEEGVSVEGTYADGSLSVTLDLPFGEVRLEASVANDQMTGTLDIAGQLTLDVNGKRTEKDVQEIKVTTRKKKKSEDGRPVAPDVNDGLEPYRRLFRGEVPVLLEVDEAIAIRQALQVLVDEFKVEVVLIGAQEAGRVAGDVKEKTKGVILPPVIVQRLDNETVVPAVELPARGLPVAFQSDGANAARGLALNAAYAVRQGMSADTALRALTSDAARMFHIEDRVGALKAGLDGDVLVFSGDPFDLASRLTHVFVAGEEVDLEELP